ncbi:12104_t:CDS:2, partial [Funneliformis geosporum]
SIQKIAIVGNVKITTQKFDKILKGGLNNLHIICDFDATMTRYYKNKNKKERNPSSHLILSSSSRLSDEEYYPIEINPGLKKEQKIPYMVEWWNKAHELLIKQQINKEDIAAMVAETPVDMRIGLKELIDKCKEKKLPFLIFSAGIGNVIEQVLIQKKLYHQENMHIVSNQMKFNLETGICDDFMEPSIHTFNKSEIAIKHSPYHTTIENRRNVILLGDSIGDLHMADGIKHDVCLTIGFLNHDVENLLKSYLENFDVVVIDDGPMDVVNIILQEIDH